MPQASIPCLATSCFQSLPARPTRSLNPIALSLPVHLRAAIPVPDHVAKNNYSSAKMNWPNLLSGFIGAALGALAGSATTIGIYWHSNISSARLRLNTKLALFRHHIWWDVKDDNVYKDWAGSLADLWELYHAYYIWALFWNKKRLDLAWQGYKGTSAELVAITPDSKRPPSGRQELLNRIDALLEVL